MRLVSPLFKHVIYPGLSRFGYLSSRSRSAPVVVTYHGILPDGYVMRDPALDGHLVSAKTFCKHATLLRSKYNLISPAEFLAWSSGELQLPARSILLTCDDGLLNTVTDMLPLIHELQFPFLFFVTGASASSERSMLWHEKLFLMLSDAASGKIQASALLRPYCSVSQGVSALWQKLILELGGRSAEARQQALEDIRTQLGISEKWEAAYSEIEALKRRFFMVNSAELRMMANEGVSIGAHTLSHPMLSRMTDAEAEDEIAESRSRIEGVAGREVWALAYPFGNAQAVGQREACLAKKAGFKCAFRNVEDANAEPYLYPRVHVGFGMSAAELDAHVSGFHFALQRRAFNSGAALAG